ncbi:MAG: coproporphyrinogen III oxidase family protein, partial [Eggerthellaceae bacterium]|nr:coproporphyrinogen III oxidase family protein [Eggerthellaceae bacterium]
VTRLSIGVQSFDDQILGLLGRLHNAAQAAEAVKMAKQRFENVSVDVICGIPGQSIKQLETTLRKVIELEVQHVSIYPLSIEEHTKFDIWGIEGCIEDIDEDQQAEHMELAAKMLREAGFVRYEVANYAKLGYASRHNIGYWIGKPYIGFGRSAVTMTQNSERRMRFQFDEVIDDLDKRQKHVEDLMLGMRMSVGISFDAIKQAEELRIPAKNCFDELCKEGFAKRTATSYVPTERGWLLANQMFEKIFELEDQ